MKNPTLGITFITNRERPEAISEIRIDVKSLDDIKFPDGDIIGAEMKLDSCKGKTYTRATKYFFVGDIEPVKNIIDHSFEYDLSNMENFIVKNYDKKMVTFLSKRGKRVAEYNPNYMEVFLNSQELKDRVHSFVDSFLKHPKVSKLSKEYKKVKTKASIRFK